MKSNWHEYRIPLLDTGRMNVVYVIESFNEVPIYDDRIKDLIKALLNSAHNNLMPEDDDEFERGYKYYPVSSLIHLHDRIFVNVCEKVMMDEYYFSKLFLEVNGSMVRINDRELVINTSEYREDG